MSMFRNANMSIYHVVMSIGRLVDIDMLICPYVCFLYTYTYIYVYVSMCYNMCTCYIYIERERDTDVEVPIYSCRDVDTLICYMSHFDMLM